MRAAGLALPRALAGIVKPPTDLCAALGAFDVGTSAAVAVVAAKHSDTAMAAQTPDSFIVFPYWNEIGSGTICPILCLKNKAKSAHIFIVAVRRLTADFGNRDKSRYRTEPALGLRTGIVAPR